jgi:hypothetical protein
MPSKYLPAADALVLAHKKWLEKDKEAALFLVAAAFDLPGIEMITSGLDKINFEIVSNNELLTESDEDEIDRGVVPTDENNTVPESDENPAEEDKDEERKLEEAMVKVLAELDENALTADDDVSAHVHTSDCKRDYLHNFEGMQSERDRKKELEEDRDSEYQDRHEGTDGALNTGASFDKDEEEDSGIEDDDLELDSDEDEDTEEEGDEDEDLDTPEEDAEEVEGKKLETDSYMEHAAVANKVSLRGEKGSILIAKKLLKNVA